MPVMAFRSSRRRVALAGAILAPLLAAPAAEAAEEPISVTIDHAKVMRISRPADVVIIGNPAIADATIQDNQTLIITGRSFGTTNLIVLDAAGQPIADQMLIVGAANSDVVTVYKRAARQTFSCTPDCSPTLTIGDNSAVFDAVNTQIESHSKMSSEASQ
jgi:Flp pilus assembly secretin CpaC